MTPLGCRGVAGRSGLGQAKKSVLAEPPFFAGVTPLVLKNLQPRDAACPAGEVRARLEIAELLPRRDTSLLVKILGVVEVSHRGKDEADDLPLVQGQHFVEVVAQVVPGHFHTQSGKGPHQKPQSYCRQGEILIDKCSEFEQNRRAVVIFTPLWRHPLHEPDA